MTPNCLIELADELLSRREEFPSKDAAERSAVSRAYYAMHLTLVAVCDSKGWGHRAEDFDGKPVPGSHNRPILALKRAARTFPEDQRASLRILADRIERYRKARVSADYYLDESLREADVRRCTSQAKDVVARLQALLEPQVNSRSA